jgi:hypothetical protein
VVATVMFVGHYAVALAAKPFAPRVSLGSTFLAVQFLDVLWAPLVLLGIEHARVVPGFLPASSLSLYYMPWTHSLVMALAWSWLAYRLTRQKVIGVCVFSHWILDFIAHNHDLPLVKSGPYFGLGLWRSQAATYWTEAVLLVLGLLVYLRATKPKDILGRVGMPVFVLLLLAINWNNIYGPTPGSISIFAIGAEAFYFAFSGIALWLDRHRAIRSGDVAGTHLPFSTTAKT